MNPLTVIAIAAFAFMFLLSLRRRREQVRHAVRGLLIGLIIGLFVFALAKSQGAKDDAALLLSMVAGAVALSMQPKRSRYIAAGVRRQKRANYELETGKKYNPKKLHLDHVIPFSRGGSNTADNLQVLPRRENLRKSARSPWWDLFD